MKNILTAACLGVLALGLAHASIIPTFVSMTNLGGGVFAYNYDVFVESPGERLQMTTTAGVGGVPSAGFDNHFTFFDFLGYVPGSASCSGSAVCGDFAVNVSNVGPSAYQQLPTDSSSLPNVTWTYNSSSTTPPGSYLGRYTLDSTAGGLGTIQFVAQSTKDTGLQDGTVTGNIVNTVGPGSLVPEPATLFLLGLGLISFSLSHKRLVSK
ncbi:MAG: PEP-CTERM sorting domain-containing protein [Acidobacteriia bacterium]|nr:PEP-CTERM sorting domain-containing protein [Terriglobia bacterium]